MKKSVAVIGLGLFGFALAEELSAMGVEVLAVDRDELAVNAISAKVAVAAVADVSRRVQLTDWGLADMDAVVICMSENLEGTILAIMQAKRAGVPEIYVKASDDEQVEIYQSLGVTHVFIPEREHAVNLARTMTSGSFLSLIELSDRVSLIRIPVREEWIGKTLMELSLRRHYGINVVALSQDGKFTIDIDPAAKLRPDAVLTVICDKKDEKRLAGS